MNARMLGTLKDEPIGLALERGVDVKAGGDELGGASTAVDQALAMYRALDSEAELADVVVIAVPAGAGKAARSHLNDLIALRVNITRRMPYVGHGAEGCRRSATIDREEAATFPDTQEGNKRRAMALSSARRWEVQAEELEEGGTDA